MRFGHLVLGDPHIASHKQSAWVGVGPFVIPSGTSATRSAQSATMAAASMTMQASQTVVRPAIFARQGRIAPMVSAPNCNFAALRR